MSRTHMIEGYLQIAMPCYKGLSKGLHGLSYRGTHRCSSVTLAVPNDSDWISHAFTTMFSRAVILGCPYMLLKVFRAREYFFFSGVCLVKSNGKINFSLQLMFGRFLSQ